MGEEKQMREKEKVNQITEGVIWKQLLLFFFPIVFGTFFQQVYNTADTIVVGRFVGKQALAAVGGSASQIANLIVGFFVGLSSGAAVVISQFYGARDKKNVEKALHTAFAFSIAAGAVLTVVGILITRPALLMMNTPEDAVADSVIYLRIYFGGMIFNLIYNMGAAILRAVGDSKRPLYVLIITCGLNIVLDILFVVLFHLGVLGVAAATVTSQVISALLVTGMLLKTKEIYVLRLSRIRFNKNMLLSVLRIGIPTGLESVMYNISNIVIQVFVNHLGTDTVAAWGTLGKIDALFWMVINAFAISITTFVGQNFGAGKYHRMRKSVRVCMIMSMIGSAVLILFMYTAAPWIYRLFTIDQAVITAGVHMSRFLLPSYFIYVIIGILSGALRGTGKVLVPMLLTCGGVCSLRILWLFSAGRMYPGINTIMLSYPVSWSITAVLFIVYYLVRFPGKEKEHR